MTEKLKNFVRNASDDQINDVVGKSITVIMLIEATITIAAYVAIKYTFGPALAEGFILLVYALTLLKKASYVEKESKQQLLNECNAVTVEDLTNDTKNEEDTIEPTNTNK